jgi:hypothetical protein
VPTARRRPFFLEISKNFYETWRYGDHPFDGPADFDAGTPVALEGPASLDA